MDSWSASSAIWSRLSPRPVSDPGQGAGGERDPRIAIGTQPRDLVEHRRDRAAASRSPAGSSAPSATATISACRRRPRPPDLRLIQPGLAEQTAHVGKDLGPVRRVRRHPVHDDLQRQTPLTHAVQDPPRHAVRVASRGRHEQSEIGGLDRAGRSGRGSRARSNRYPERRRGRVPARSSSSSTNRTSDGGMPSERPLGKADAIVGVDAGRPPRVSSGAGHRSRSQRDRRSC